MNKANMINIKFFKQLICYSDELACVVGVRTANIESRANLMHFEKKLEVAEMIFKKNIFLKGHSTTLFC